MVGGMSKNEGERGGERGERFGITNMKMSIRVLDHEILRQID
jgi:hypothetical protein